MSKHRRPRRRTAPGAGLLLSVTAMLAAAPAAAGATPSPGPAPHLPAPGATPELPGATPGLPAGDGQKGSPAAAGEFFLRHLDTYHWGRTLVGFNRAAENPYDWAVYHLVTTGLETAARGVSPQQAPEVSEDDWVPTEARPAAQQGHGQHGPPSHRGQPLRLPVDPAAGPSYLSKALGGDGPAVSQPVPTAQETARRALTPTEGYPPVRDDDWNDRRPVDDGTSNTVLGPDQADVLASASGDVVGPVAGGAVNGVFER